MVGNARWHLHGMLAGEGFTLILGGLKYHYELVASGRFDEEGQPIMLARDSKGGLVTLGQIAAANGNSYFVQRVEQEALESVGRFAERRLP
jgi:hypothetical protein